MTAVNLQEETGLSKLARGLVGSEILRVAAEIRTLTEQGREICNLTVGDFSPREFRIPKKLEELIAAAFAAGETNYPPSDGVKELRQAVVRFFQHSHRLTSPIASVLIAEGSAPISFAI